MLHRLPAATVVFSCEETSAVMFACGVLTNGAEQQLVNRPKGVAV